ncbi:MAG: aldolase catalytic domain-containing protein [Oscillospiraceae bacterium]|nr:aldolase catalytic domain-containing protein [Oscillospiraceae bacterium]
MRKRFLLDCTLRDGGYINDWEFGHDNIVNIFERVVSAGVEVIEIGFLDDRRVFDLNRSIMPSTECVSRIYGKLDRRSTMVVGMIDYGTCDISNLQPCSESWLDGIRVIFKKDKMYDAMAFCGQVKALGYQVFAQLVSVTSYSDDELLEVIRLANETAPFAVSMVDTYGLLNPRELTHIMEILDRNLSPGIVLGFHAHNNFQLGYTNATTVLDYDTDRDILVDGTLYGMGKSAGNAPLELVAMYMNEHCGKHYAISEMQEAITTSVLDFQRRSPWGYQLFYYIAAANKVHPNYVSYLMNKRTLSITAINEILQRIPEDQKLEKNMKLAEQLYIDYQRCECDDSGDLSRLGSELAGHKTLVIGPGPSVGAYSAEIQHYIEAEHPVVIAINYIPAAFRPHYLFLTNNTRYLQSKTKLLDAENAGIRLIASSNLTGSGREFDFVVNYSGFIDTSAEFPDNSMCMLLRVLVRCGCGEVVLAGLDGYTADSVNYFDVDKEYSFLREKAESLNRYAREFFRQIPLKVSFLTPSEYQKG